MRALSVRQPWAEAIVEHGKRVENRTWYTQFRGEILIHAGKGCTRGEYEDAARWMSSEALASWPRWSDRGPKRRRALEDLHRGGFVARARLVAVVGGRGIVDHERDLRRLRQLQVDPRWWIRVQYGFVLADVEPIPFVPWKGELGIFNVDDTAFAAAAKTAAAEPVGARHV